MLKIGTVVYADVKIMNDAFLYNNCKVIEFAKKLISDFSLTEVKSVSHHFDGHGLTYVGILSESHLAIHTWPEYRYMAIDLFTCGNHDLSNFDKYIKELFEVESINVAIKERIVTGI